MRKGSHKGNTHRDDERLQEVKPYIDAVVRKIVPTTFSYDDREELAQKSWIKYWRITQEKEIHYPKAYIRHIVHSEFITTIRKGERSVQIVTGEDGEPDLAQGKILVEESEGMGNPEDVFERAVAADERLDEAIRTLARLPKRQQQTMSATLWEKLDNLIPFIDAMGRHKLEITYWPVDRVKKQRLQASRPPALKSMASLMGIDTGDYQHWHDKKMVSQF